MCYSVECSKWGKTSWGGCGRPVPGVYNAIADKEKSVCLCKSWPGVCSSPLHWDLAFTSKSHASAQAGDCLELGINAQLDSQVPNSRQAPVWAGA
uniref:Uncharacterized protein n=2 Tax=Physcomitrium patens TaxID=3218 RepID=A0A2K1IWP7_PHYPA|nr:hypothetical protein PHYPA_023523 [Physcomitrium patens]